MQGKGRGVLSRAILFDNIVYPGPFALSHTHETQKKTSGTTRQQQDTRITSPGQNRRAAWPPKEGLGPRAANVCCPTMYTTRTTRCLKTGQHPRGGQAGGRVGLAKPKTRETHCLASIFSNPVALPSSAAAAEEP